MLVNILKVCIRFITAVLAIPVTYGISVALYKSVIHVSELAHTLNFFLWGILAYIVLHILFYRPTYLYVLGHEAVHAGVGWMMGSKIKSFKASKDGGAVGMDKSNMVIELSPYFVPIYAIVISIIYFVIVSSYNINGSFFIFLIGFALAFHLISTIEILKVRQPDIVKSGYFFSIMMVYILNIIVIAVLFSFIFPSFSISKFFINTYNISLKTYIAIAKQLFF
jgi:hypothetical protein